MESRPERGIGQLVAGNILTTAGIRYGDREAFFCSETDRRFTFRQVDERCNRIANALTAMGLKKGDVVAVLTSNRVELVEILFALAKTGIVGMPLNYRLAPAELFALMNTVNAQALLCEARFKDVLDAAPAEVPTLRDRVMFGGPAAPGILDYEDLLAASSPAEPEIEVEETDPFYFNLTSGTSGLPKCYVLTHYNNATVTPMFTTMDVTRNDTFLTVFPMFGRVGYAWIAAGLYFGVRNVLANFDPGRVLQLIQDERVTITNLVATMGAMLLQHPDLPRRDLSSLRGTVFAGSMLPEPIRRGVTERICPHLYEYYGMQETGALVVSNPEDRKARPDSVGRVIPHAEVRIVDDHGRRLPAGEIGEIIGRSPTGTTAYYQNPEKSAETFRNGWIHTGDLGSIDAEGYQFLRGRKKDMIITGGQNVFAAEVEETILDFPEVVECAVIGLPDPLWGERVSAVVVVTPGSRLSADELVRHCRERLASFKTPKEVLLQSEPLPRTPTGKVQKFILVERHAGDASAAPDA